jgi:hypothetical protein
MDAMIEHLGHQYNPSIPEGTILTPTNKFVLAAIAEERRRSPTDFTERSLIHIGRTDPELARHMQAEAKRLGTSSLSKEEIARQMATWIYKVMEAQVAANQMEAQFGAEEPVLESPSITAVEFREPPAA